MATVEKKKNTSVAKKKVGKDTKKLDEKYLSYMYEKEDKEYVFPESSVKTKTSKNKKNKTKK